MIARAAPPPLASAGLIVLALAAACERPAATVEEEAEGRQQVVQVRQLGLDLAGLRAAPARPAAIERGAPLVGQLEWDPGRRAEVRVPAAGRFRLLVGQGQNVAAEQVIGWLQSPELYPDSLALVAPLAGTVIETPAGPAGLAAAWQEVAEVAARDTLRLRVPVYPEQYPDLGTGSRLRLRPPGGSGPGRVVRVGALAGPEPGATGPGRLQAIARVPNRDGRLWPGMTVAVELILRDSLPGVWVPAASVLYDRGRRVAFVVAPNGYREVEVSVARRTGDSVFVSSGVERGDSVVAEGAYQLLYAGFSFRGIGAEAGEMEEGEEDDL